MPSPSSTPPLVRNPSGQRRCETEVGRRYGRWKVSAHSSNLTRPALAGVSLLRRLEADGWRYDDGRHGPPDRGRHAYEVYPFTTLVGAEGLGYDVERPAYKRRPRSVPSDDFRRLRAATCDELIGRLVGLARCRSPVGAVLAPGHGEAGRRADPARPPGRQAP